MLNRRNFHYVTKKLNVSPSIDLFASRLNTQLPEFISYRPDPESKAVNAFTQSSTELKFYALPPFLCLPRVMQKIWHDRAEVILVVPDWHYQLCYSQFCNMITKDILLPPRQDLLLSPTDPNIRYLLHQTLQLRRNSLREAVKTTHNSERVQDLLLASWAPKTQANYNTYISKWLKYCSTEGISDQYMASYYQAMSFLSSMFYEEKGKYGTIAVGRSALSSILPKVNGQTFAKDERVSRVIKRIFKLRPSLPKYIVTYNPDIILQYMDSLPTNNLLSMDLLTKKFCTFLCLLNGQRSQTISSLKVDGSVLAYVIYTFYINTIQKTTRPGRHHPLWFSGHLNPMKNLVKLIVSKNIDHELIF